MHRRDFVRLLGAGALATAGVGAAAPLGRAQPLILDPARDLCRPRFTPAAATWPQPRGPLSIEGTRLVKDGFAEEVAAAYLEATGRSVRVVGGGCDDGIAALENGRVHFAGVCCAHAPNTPLGDLKMITVADDLKVVLTHPSNPVKDIRLADVRAVCRGEIRNWRDLGGPDRTIALVVFDHCLNYVEPVRKRLFRNRPEWSPAALIAKTDDSLLQSIARFEWSIGINSWVLARSLVAAGKLKALALDGIPPARDGSLSPDYPLKGDLALAFAHWDAETMRPFFDFIFSAPGRAIVAKRALPRTAAEAGYT